MVVARVHFFVKPINSIDYKTVFAGSSYSVEIPNYKRFPFLVRKYIDYHYLTVFQTSENLSYGGTGTWYNKLLLYASISGYSPDLLILENGNDVDIDPHKRQLEAFIRRSRTDLPNCKMVYVFIPYISDGNATNPPSNIWGMSLCASYDVAAVDVATPMQAAIDGGGSIDDYYTGPDYIHPNGSGNEFILNLITDIISNPYLLSGAQWSPPLPERIYDDGSYEYEATIRNATDNDGETGTGWSTIGTSRQSSTENDTISWTGTFVSWGLDTNYSTGAGTLAWSIDGGDFTNIDLTIYGIDNNPVQYLSVRGEHTVTIKVISGLVKINRFLAI